MASWAPGTENDLAVLSFGKPRSSRRRLIDNLVLALDGKKPKMPLPRWSQTQTQTQSASLAR